MNALRSRLRGALGRLRTRYLRVLLLGGVPAVALALAAQVYLSGGRYVSTDNAYVKADKIAVSADISGRVVAVTVREHQQVAEGATLFRLDDLPGRLALDQAEAQLGSVRRDIESLRAVYGERQAALQRAEQQTAFLAKEYRRLQDLVRGGLAPSSQQDAAEHELRNAELQAASVREDLQRALTDLGGDPATPTESHPRYQQARAQRDQAQLNLDRTVIRAPIAGIVGPMLLTPGEYVQVGQPVFTIVGAQPWVEANLKETELTHTRAGQRAWVRIDAYPEHTWPATVASISPATGAEFSLLPPQNASGNWVKVVQRVPVRLTLLPAGDLPPLRSGMSATVEIDTGFERALPEVLRKAMAWGRSGP
jgi:membrane fusion protein (multidrug efflux system)